MKGQEYKILKVDRKRIIVDKEIYTAYYQLREHEAYLNKLSLIHNISYEECEDKGIQVDYLLSCKQESIEDIIIKQDMLENMLLCLKKLPKEDQLLINNLFFKDKSETQVAMELHINQSNVNRRKAKVLDKIRKLMKI